MITIETEYPFGKKKVCYDSWQYIIDDGSNRLVKTVTDQESYERLIEEFNRDKEKYKNDNRFVEYNSHYFELQQKNSKNIVKNIFYIIGYLNSEQYDRA